MNTKTTVTIADGDSWDVTIEIGLSPAEEQELRELQIHFERSGGRGVDVAERIDHLVAKRDGDLPAAACIFDGTYGWHNTYRLVDLAVEHGWGLSEDDKADLADYKADQGSRPESGERVHELADLAEQYLNDKLVTEGWQFGWHEGEFFLANTAWWEAQG
jgi:hypothetical protein